jgi:HTH-type transcriptional regulator/antitoxin HipB
MKLNVQKTSERSTLRAKTKTPSKVPMTFVTNDEMIDKHVGKKGTAARDEFEHRVRMRGLGYMIQKTRKEQKLTQEQLGKLVGVQKARISKLENGAGNATIDTIVNVFKALNAEVHFKIKLNGKYLPFT